MTERKKVLVVEDDEALLMGLEENLNYAGYEVLTAVDGAAGYRAAKERRPDLVILDVMLPGMSGYEVCRRLREEGVSLPIVMLTARHEEFDKLLGFDVGADDYVTKPFSLKELLARVKAVLRREERRTGQPAVYEFGDCRLDMESRALTRGGEAIPLTRTEFELLAYFLGNQNKVLPREVLLNDIWGVRYLGTQRSLDSFVASLRKKIEKRPHAPRFIITAHGVGYKFAGPEGQTEKR